MTRLTALELLGNYPENILVETPLMECGKYALYVYLTREGDIHKLMFNTQPEWDTTEGAMNYLNELYNGIKNKIKNE